MQTLRGRPTTKATLKVGGVYHNGPRIRTITSMPALQMATYDSREEMGYLDHFNRPRVCSVRSFYIWVRGEGHPPVATSTIPQCIVDLNVSELKEKGLNV